jgi:hypothetical protein
MDKKLKEFCYKYESIVGPSKRMLRRTVPIPFSTFQEQGFSAFDTREVKDIPMVEITMPEDRFRALLEHDAWVERAGLQDNGFFNNNVMRVSNLIVEHERECKLRAEHSAVQKAWEQYQIMLKMVDDGR